MTMDTIFATLACCLLASPFAQSQKEHGNLPTTPTITTSDLSPTNMTASVTQTNSTEAVTVTSDLTESTTPFNSTTWDNKTFTTTTAATTVNTSTPETSQSTTAATPHTNSTSLTITTHITPTITSTPATQTTDGYISTTDSSVITTTNSSHTANTTSPSLDSTTQVLRLNNSEKTMTIIFSVVLGLFAMALVGFTLHKCKHKIQYLHRPLNNTEDTADAFVADDDTLIISGGLYDGHPIYDNVPTASTDQSQFRLEFLH